MTLTNHRILLRSRPTGIPHPDNFVSDIEAIRRPGKDEVLLETVYLSIEPATRSWMSDNPGYQRAVPFQRTPNLAAHPNLRRAAFHRETASPRAKAYARIRPVPLVLPNAGEQPKVGANMKNVSAHGCRWLARLADLYWRRVGVV